jgi:competence protein ComEA
MLRTLLTLVTLSVFVIARPGAASPTQASSGDRVPAKAAKTGTLSTVNINTASAKELDALPGIGAKTAALIVEYRQKNGPFKKIEELMNVRGVGEKSFLKLKPQLTVTPLPATTVKAERPKP